MPLAISINKAKFNKAKFTRKRACRRESMSSSVEPPQQQVEKLTLVVAENKTGYFGVSLDKPGRPKPYKAQVWRDGKDVYLGSFATAEEAALCVARSPEGQAVAATQAAAAAAALCAAACPSGDRATHSAASSAVAKLPRFTILPPLHTCTL